MCEAYSRVSARIFQNAFKLGFLLQNSGPRASVFQKLSSPADHEDILSDNEVLAGCNSGPYVVQPMPNLYVSLKGVVPKADGEWCMLSHLSYPPSASFNDHIQLL